MKHRLYAAHDATGDASSAAKPGSGGPPLSAAQCAAVAAFALPSKPLPSSTVACYSVGHFMNDACASCWFSYLLLYLENVQGLSGLQSGIVIFSGQLFDALATPIVGILSDRSRGLPALGLGRRKLWNAIGTVIVVVCFFFVFGVCLPCVLQPGGGADPPASATAKTASFAVFASLFNVGWAAVQVSHMALVPELTVREDERVLLNSMRYGATILANVFVFGVMWLILHLREGGGSAGGAGSVVIYSSSSFTMLTYAVLGVGGLLSLVFLVGTPEPPCAPLPSSSAGRSGSASDGASVFAPLLAVEEGAEEGGGDASKPNGAHHALGAATASEESYVAPRAVGLANGGGPPTDRNGNGVSAPSSPPPPPPPPLLHPLPPPLQLLAAPPSPARLSSPAGGGALPGVTTRRRGPGARGGAADADSFTLDAPGAAPPTPPLDHALSFVWEAGRREHMAWHHWLALPSFWKTAGVYMATRLAVNVSQVYLSFYVTTTLDLDQTAIAIVPLVVYISSLVATTTMKRISTTLGRFWALVLGGALFNAGCAAMFFLQEGPTAPAVYAAVVLLGAGSAIAMVISVSMEADLVGTNTESGAFVYGALSLTDKLSNGIVIVVVQVLADVLAADSKPNFFRYVNALVPGAAMTCAILVAAFMRFPETLQGSASFREWKSRQLASVVSSAAGGGDRDSTTSSSGERGARGEGGAALFKAVSHGSAFGDGEGEERGDVVSLLPQPDEARRDAPGLQVLSPSLQLLLQQPSREAGGAAEAGP